MTAISVAALFVYVLGAFAYGSALILSLRRSSPVWAPHRSATDGPSRPEVGSLLLFAVSAVWFVLQTRDRVPRPARWAPGRLDRARRLGAGVRLPAAHHARQLHRSGGRPPRCAGVGAARADARCTWRRRWSAPCSSAGWSAGCRRRRCAGLWIGAGHQRPVRGCRRLLGGADESRDGLQRGPGAPALPAGDERALRRPGDRVHRAGVLPRPAAPRGAALPAGPRRAAGVPRRHHLLREQVRVLRPGRQAGRHADGDRGAARGVLRGDAAAPRPAARDRAAGVDLRARPGADRHAAAAALHAAGAAARHGVVRAPLHDHRAR